MTCRNPAKTAPGPTTKLGSLKTYCTLVSVAASDAAGLDALELTVSMSTTLAGIPATG